MHEAKIRMCLLIDTNTKFSNELDPIMIKIGYHLASSIRLLNMQSAMNYTDAQLNGLLESKVYSDFYNKLMELHSKPIG